VVHSLLQPDIRISTLKIDLGLFPYLAFLAFLGTGISSFRTFGSLREILLYISIKLVALIALYSFWAFIQYALEVRDNSVLKIWQVMLIGICGGIVFSLGEEGASWIFSYSLNLDFTPRALSHAVAAAFWLPAGSVVSRNLKRYRRLRGEVREQFLQQESIRLARGLALDEYQRQIENQIQQKLEVTSSEASRLLQDVQNSNVKKIPEYLRIISTEYFSLLGRSISHSSSQKIIGISRLKTHILILLKTLHESISTRPLDALWFSIMVTSTVLQHLIQRFDTYRVVEVTGVIFVTVYLIQKLQLLWIRYFNVRQIATTVVFTSITVILPLTILNLLVPVEDQVSRFGAFGLLIIVVTICGHFAQAGLLRFTDFRLESIKELSKVRADERDVNLLFLQITKDWASYIHGSITSKLESAAIEIENALKEEDYAAVARSMDRVNLYLKSDSSMKKSSEVILLDEVSEKVGAWDGLIDIEITSNISRAETVNVSIGDVGSCIEEAILNASRHGDCSSMKIEIIDTESVFRIICTDDGIGFSGTPAGLGAKIFNQATQGGWTLIRDTSRSETVLTLDFPKI